MTKSEMAECVTRTLTEEGELQEGNLPVFAGMEVGVGETSWVKDN